MSFEARRSDLSELDGYARAHPQLCGDADIPPLLAWALRSVDRHHAVILDLGAGEALTLVAVRKRRTPSLLVAVELSAERARIAQRNGLGVVVGDGLRLPLRASSVDLVICRHVIEHVPSDRDLLLEIRRVMKQDAFAYIETPIRLPGAWYPYRNHAGEWVLDPTHVREYRSVDEIRRVIAGGRLEVVALRVRPITYAVTHVLYRLVRGRNRPGRFARFLVGLRRPRLPVPRYREAQLLIRARREEPEPQRRTG